MRPPVARRPRCPRHSRRIAHSGARKRIIIVPWKIKEVKQRMWGDAVCGAGDGASPPDRLLISSFGTGTARSPKTAHQTAGLLYFITAGANEREASLCSFQWLICVGKTPKLPCILPLINKLQYIINLSSKEGSSESFSQWEVLRQLTTFLKSNGFTCLFFIRRSD